MINILDCGKLVILQVRQHCHICTFHRYVETIAYHDPFSWSSCDGCWMQTGDTRSNPGTWPLLDFFYNPGSQLFRLFMIRLTLSVLRLNKELVSSLVFMLWTYNVRWWSTLSCSESPSPILIPFCRRCLSTLESPPPPSFEWVNAPTTSSYSYRGTGCFSSSNLTSLQWICVLLHCVVGFPFLVHQSINYFHSTGGVVVHRHKP